MNLSILYPNFFGWQQFSQDLKKQTFCEICIFLSQFSTCSNLSLFWVCTVYTSRLKQTVTRVYSSRGWYFNSTLKMWDFAPINCPFLAFLSHFSFMFHSNLWGLALHLLLSSAQSTVMSSFRDAKRPSLPRCCSLLWSNWHGFAGVTLEEGLDGGSALDGGVQHVEGCIEVQVWAICFQHVTGPRCNASGAGILMSFFLIRGKDGERHQMMDHACRVNTFLHSQFRHETFSMAGARSGMCNGMNFIFVAIIIIVIVIIFKTWVSHLYVRSKSEKDITMPERSDQPLFQRQWGPFPMDGSGQDCASTMSRSKMAGGSCPRVEGKRAALGWLCWGGYTYE